MATLAQGKFPSPPTRYLGPLGVSGSPFKAVSVHVLGLAALLLLSALPKATQAQISLLEIQSSRLATAVALIEALGGGWTTADLPKS